MMRKIPDLAHEKQQPDLLISIFRESYGTYDFY
jgi:hypothetical protein